MLRLPIAPVNITVRFRLRAFSSIAQPHILLQILRTGRCRRLLTYACDNALTVARSYEDDGRSGLSIDGRTGPRQLRRDVFSPKLLFDVLPVYDVSRLGHFQDADESAYYEFLCRSAGVQVIYVAEPFDNDGTAISNIRKTIKRTKAAENSRELSEKVALGKRRLAALGWSVRRSGRPG